MSEVNEYAPGTFCWVELATTDQNAAKQFYQQLLGLDVKDIPIGEGPPIASLRKKEETPQPSTQ